MYLFLVDVIFCPSVGGLHLESPCCQPTNFLNYGLAMHKYEHIQVQVAATKPSLVFFSASQLEQDHEGVHVWTDDDEWNVRI